MVNGIVIVMDVTTTVASHTSKPLTASVTATTNVETRIGQAASSPPVSTAPSASAPASATGWNELGIESSKQPAAAVVATASAQARPTALPTGQSLLGLGRAGLRLLARPHRNEYTAPSPEPTTISPTGPTAGDESTGPPVS